MGFKCIVIDDEQYAATAIAKYVNDMPNLTLANIYTDPLLALSEITAADQIDFIFLDIEMPGISGLDLAKSLRSKSRFLIFITSHDKHAITAFGLKANHYLLKPVTLAQFALVVNELVKDEVPAASASFPNKQLKFIKAGQKNSYYNLNFNDIISIQAQKNYVMITTVEGNFSTHLGISQIEEVLPPIDFIRLSKSYIIAKKEIRKIEGNLVKLKNNDVFQVGETYKPHFLKWVKENMISDK
jgi:two-component system LytT family response regulator